MLKNGIVLNGISKDDNYFYGMLCESNYFVKINSVTFCVEALCEIEGLQTFSRRHNTDKTFYWNKKVYIVIWGDNKIYVFNTILNQFTDPIILPDKCLEYHNAVIQRDSKIELFPCWKMPRISVDLNKSIAYALPTPNFEEYNMAECCDVLNDVVYLADRFKGVIYKYNLNSNEVEIVEISPIIEGYLGIKVVEENIVILHSNQSAITLYNNDKIREVFLDKKNKHINQYFSFDQTFKNIVVWKDCIYIFSDNDASILEINPFKGSVDVIFEEAVDNNKRAKGFLDIYQDGDMVYKTSMDGRSFVIYNLSEKKKYIQELSSEIDLGKIKSIFENRKINNQGVLYEDGYYGNLGTYLDFILEK